MFSGFKNVDGGGDDVDINRACRSVTIWETWLLWDERGQTVIQWILLKIIRLKKEGLIPVVAEFKSNKWRKSEQCNTWNE
jgi:hypothetical protein